MVRLGCLARAGVVKQDDFVLVRPSPSLLDPHRHVMQVSVIGHADLQRQRGAWAPPDSAHTAQRVSVATADHDDLDLEPFSIRVGRIVAPPAARKSTLRRRAYNVHVIDERHLVVFCLAGGCMHWRRGGPKRPSPGTLQPSDASVGEHLTGVPHKVDKHDPGVFITLTVRTNVPSDTEIGEE